jgi:hypothetical protein
MVIAYIALNLHNKIASLMPLQTPARARTTADTRLSQADSSGV